MITFARQVAVLAVTKEMALEGFLHFLRTHEGKAKDYPDYVAARLTATGTLQKLAVIEQAYGHDGAAEWLDRAVERAQAKLAEVEGTDAP
jgi:hypothetical protein